MDNWNNFANNGGLGLVNLDPTDLINETGADTGFDIIWNVSQSAFNSNNGQGNQRMMEGWFGVNAVNGDHITIEGLPQTYTDGIRCVRLFRFGPGGTSHDDFCRRRPSLTGTELPVNYPGQFIEASDEGEGNYVVFRGLTDDNFSLTAVTNDGGPVSVNSTTNHDGVAP